jgi:hypothetical protein
MPQATSHIQPPAQYQKNGSNLLDEEVTTPILMIAEGEVGAEMTSRIAVGTDPVMMMVIISDPMTIILGSTTVVTILGSTTAVIIRDLMTAVTTGEAGGDQSS